MKYLMLNQKGAGLFKWLIILAVIVIIVILVLPQGEEADSPAEVMVDELMEEADHDDDDAMMEAGEEAMADDDEEAVMEEGETMMEENEAGEVMTDKEDREAMEEESTSQESTGSEAVVVDYTDDGFASADVSISSGDTVTFTNSSSRSFWPATDVHPTHRVYPGSDIQKCFSGQADEVFDACAALEPGDSYSFTFTEAGEWDYHDHLRAALGGTITVN